MIFREAKLDDVKSIMSVIEDGKKSLKLMGIDQWQKGSPNEIRIVQDIQNHESFIIEVEGEVVGTAALVRGVDPGYEAIYEGEWKGNHPYVSIHRVAVAEKHKKLGVASQLLKCVEYVAKEWGFCDIRIDTHPGNIVMQKWIEKHQFIYCGKVDLTDGMRLAYQKIV